MANQSVICLDITAEHLHKLLFCALQHNVYNTFPHGSTYFENTGFCHVQLHFSGGVVNCLVNKLYCLAEVTNYVKMLG